MKVINTRDGRILEHYWWKFASLDTIKNISPEVWNIFYVEKIPFCFRNLRINLSKL